MLSKALVEKLLAFRHERDWEQFHNFRTLSTSIVLEAAELAEITQWAKDSELQSVVDEKRERIEQEVADIAILLSYLVHDTGIDLERAVEKKLALNEGKYPVEQARGSARKYDELES